LCTFVKSNFGLLNCISIKRERKLYSRAGLDQYVSIYQMKTARKAQTWDASSRIAI